MWTAADLGTGPLHHVPHPICVVGHDGVTVYANPAAVATLGFDNAVELQGLPRHRTLHPRRPHGAVYPEDECPLEHARRTGRPAAGEQEWFARSDGSMFAVTWSSAPVETAGGLGAVIAFAATPSTLDVTSQLVENDVVVRRTIARQMHEGAQQRLILLLVALQLARAELADSDRRLSELLDDATVEAERAVNDLREVAARIHPTILTTLGLPAAVDSLAGRCPLPVTVRSSSERRLPATIEAVAYDAVVESLDNAVRHSVASRVTVTIDAGPDVLTVEVADDGVGGAVRDGRGRGLDRLARRIEAVGGAMTLTSRAGEGTTVLAHLPAPGDPPPPGRRGRDA